MRIGPLPIRWVAEHRDYIPNRQFCDVQLRGPFAVWKHTHRMSEVDEHRATLEDQIEYQLPLGAVGRRLGGWLIRRKLERMFAYRHETTRRLIETGDRAERQPATRSEAGGEHG